MSAAAPDLTRVRGVVIKQVTQIANAAFAVLDAPFEVPYMYDVHAMPADKRAAREQGGGGGVWAPTLAEIQALPQLLSVREESSACLRVALAALGGLNLRALTLHCGVGPHAPDVFTIDRPCKFGGCCCSPLEMHMRAGAAPLGSVVEDWSCRTCAEQTCCCIYTHKVLLPGAQHRFSLRTGLCCAGRVNNCCGATCCKRDLIMDVVSPGDGNKLVSTVQKTYAAGSGCEACMRCAVEFDTYILEFPEGSSHEERALLIAAVLSHDYALFSRTGGDNDN